MSQLRKLLIQYERFVLFVVIIAVWLGAYFAIPLVPPVFAPRFVGWDPMWHVPFVAVFIVPYVSAYIMPLLFFALPYDRAQFRRLVTAVAASVVITSIFFIVLPLQLPKPVIGGTDIFSRLVIYLYGVDTPGNLFPSQHVTMSFLFAFSLAQLRPKWLWPMLAWAALIAVSTMFVRQHYLIDVVAGLTLALIVRATILRPTKSL